MVDLIETLQKKGAMEVILALKDGEKQRQDLLDDISVANGTIQRRMKALQDAELVDEQAKVTGGGRAVKTYVLTDKGSNVADILAELPHSNQF